MTKRSRDASANPLRREASAGPEPSENEDNESSREGGDGLSTKKPRSFIATLACNVCRSRKTRCDEDRPKCGYCRNMNIECTYQTPRPTKRDQSMTVAINAIRRLEGKVEDLTAAIRNSGHSSPAAPTPCAPPSTYARTPPVSTCSQPSPKELVTGTSGKSQYAVVEPPGAVKLSFSQHGVTLWPGVRQILPEEFNVGRAQLSSEYVIDIESQRSPLPMHIDFPVGSSPESWLSSLPVSVIKGLADAYFAVFHRAYPVLDKYFFYSSTLGIALDSEFGYDIETCLVLNVLALGCLAVQTHEEGDFALPSRFRHAGPGFVQPEWYDLVLDVTPGLKFFNEARKRAGFLMCQNDLETGQFYMLMTHYYAQILRPLDSWTTVNRAALCCLSILAKPEGVNYEQWEGDMFSRLFWVTLMYETIITQECSLPLSGLLDYEADVPIPKFTACPKPKTSISGLLVDEDEAYFNLHFLAQASLRIILTRVRHNLYTFAEKEGYPSPTLTAEMHYQLEQWRTNLPPSLQFTDEEDVDGSPSPAHVLAKAMLRGRYMVVKYHIGRPFLYKALHAPDCTTESEYSEIGQSFRSGMYWPTIMGPCSSMLSALPVKFGWCSQCFGQVLAFHVVSRSPESKLRETLPEGWPGWVEIMKSLLERCAKESPGVAKDLELLRLL